jgi:leader peptidase (prepilin peptidase)/N-methyltransferase
VSSLITAVNAFWGFALGAVIGSYLSCVAWRLPRKVSLAGRSVCPSCGAQLMSRWNVPLVGWLALRGRSGCCQTPISWRYPAYELLGAIVLAVVGLLTGLLGVGLLAGLVVAVTAIWSKMTAIRPPPTGARADKTPID